MCLSLASLKKPLGEDSQQPETGENEALLTVYIVQGGRVTAYNIKGGKASNIQVERRDVPPADVLIQSAAGFISAMTTRIIGDKAGKKITAWTLNGQEIQNPYKAIERGFQALGAHQNGQIPDYKAGDPLIQQIFGMDGNNRGILIVAALPPQAQNPGATIGRIAGTILINATGENIIRAGGFQPTNGSITPDMQRCIKKTQIERFIINTPPIDSRVAPIIGVLLPAIAILIAEKYFGDIYAVVSRRLLEKWGHYLQRVAAITTMYATGTYDERQGTIISAKLEQDPAQYYLVKLNNGRIEIARAILSIFNQLLNLLPSAIRNKLLENSRNAAIICAYRIFEDYTGVT